MMMGDGVEMDGIPTETDWRSEVWDLDIPYAYEHFFGKSNAEAQQLFIENAIYYQEDLMFMPTACLRYYIHAYIDYLLSGASKGDSDGANSFFGLIEARHEDVRNFDEHTVRQTRAVLDRLAASQEWFDAEEEAYGNFTKRAAKAIAFLAGSPNA